jgi:hypothetical protein
MASRRAFVRSGGSKSSGLFVFDKNGQDTVRRLFCLGVFCFATFLVVIFRRLGGLVDLDVGNFTVDHGTLFWRSRERPWSMIDGRILVFALVTGSNMGFLFLPLFIQNTDSLPCFLTQEMYLEHASPVT